MTLSKALLTAAVVTAFAFQVAVVAEGPASQPASAPAASAEQIKTLIAELGDENARKRDNASKQLEAIGVPALPELRKNAASKDPEVASRIKALLENIPKAAAEKCLAWKIEAAGGRAASLVLTKDLAIYYGGDMKVHAVELATGKSKWEYEVGQAYQPILRVMGDKVVFAGPGTTPPLAINLAKGDLAWKSEVQVQNCRLGDDQILCLDNRNQVVSLALKDGEEIWKKAASDFIEGGNANTRAINLMAVKDAAVVILQSVVGGKASTVRNTIVAVSRDKGEKLWNVALDNLQVLSMDRDDQNLAMLLCDGTKGSSSVAICDLKSGKSRQIEVALADGMVWNTGLRFVGELLVCAGPQKIIAYSVKDGKEQWNYTPAAATPMKAVGGGVGVVGRMPMLRGQVYGLGARDLPLAMLDADSFVMATADALLAMDVKSGKPLWKYSTPSSVFAGPIFQDGRVFFSDSGAGGGAIRDGVIIKGNVKVIMVNGKVAVNETVTDTAQANQKACVYALNVDQAKLLGVNPQEEVDTTAK